MGVYTEYLDKLKTFDGIAAERKTQLQRISKLRGDRPILVIASDIQKGKTPISIDYSDPLPIRDQLDNLNGTQLDVILETPGGIGEVAEDIVKLMRARFAYISFIVPGIAKSAGTIMVMGGDEILMDDASSLGPIDAQMSNHGKTFSADAFLEGLEKIKEEVSQTGTLNKAYIPILQGISPGEIESCRNAQNFSQTLVTDWLAHNKFRDWKTHSTTNAPVTDAERMERAKDIAAQLCDHGRWLTHGRSIKIGDLRAMKLLITDYGDTPDLQDAIKRYYTLMRLSFDNSSIYKLIETPSSQIYRFAVVQGTPQPQPGSTPGQEIGGVQIPFQCPKCHETFMLQADFDVAKELKKGNHPFPSDNGFVCPKCGAKHDLFPVRSQIEAQMKRKIVTPKEQK